MEGILEFIVSVNKISLVAFVGVFIFLIYEISLLRKEKMKQQKPTIPQFNDKTVAVQPPVAAQAPILPPIQQGVSPLQTHQNLNPFLVVIIVLVCISTIVISLFFVLNKKQESAVTPTPIVTEIKSKGLKVFDLQWNEIPEASMSALHPGDKVYIALLTISDADVDRARIKVNETEWNIKHITLQLNAQKKMYYREYTIATGESKLKIDAQLHSATDGWLGD